MKYHFIEYIANEMIPGDWRWYLDTYKTKLDGARDWSAQFSEPIQIYNFPRELADSVVTEIAFTPAHSIEFEGKPMPAPKGVRWGSVTCVRRDFADLLAQNLDTNVEKSSIRLRNGAIIHEWVPIFVRNQLYIPIEQKDDSKTIVKRLSGESIFCCSRYSLILPERFFRLVAGFNFKGVRISSAESK
jgi:hypothetical protein